MENLLRIDFINQHSLPACTLTNLSQNVNFDKFEINDIARVLTVTQIILNGEAKYENPNNKDIFIHDYDGFLTNTPNYFQNGKKRCDAIVHTDDNSYFLLNELKNRKPKTSVLSHATSQMIATLNELIAVPTINTFISHFRVKKCCYCNSQSTAPATITATSAFNRLSTITSDGLKLTNPVVESLGFELWEYSGNQTIKII